MQKQSDIIIVGGGLNGPALALALAQTGFSVTVIDALSEKIRRNAAFDGRSYALALTSQRLLDGIGIWQDIAEHAEPMLEIKVTDGRAGEGPSPFFMHFDHAEIEEGPMGYMVEDRHLRRAFLDAMAATPGITHLSGKTVVAQSVGPASASVTLDSGKIITGSLLIGSDGRASGTAERAGIKRTGWGYGQTALVCAVAHEKPHNGIAHQFFMPPGPLAILPLTGNRCSIVWSETDAEAQRINALDDAGYLDVLRPRFGDFLGDISLAGKRFTYPLNLTIANRFVAPRLALIGDAAHGVHPIAGQGLNAGLRDVAALAETLTLAARRGEDIGSPLVLERYEQWRRFDTATLAAATDAFNRLFSNDNALLRAGRDIGMGIVNAIPSLRRGFIREAAGLTGDVPRLMQGKAI
ncbi:2-octaprenyl-6-methoxyphenyl hydroxylase [Sulfitobacter sp. JL08]|uniref:FAD-dependent monooxygenase n=1 Tax=Sulfitobacter sp. JL08 TaxID=2070369 RepID=UPI000E0BF563|nr:FAD-dependent monooxygenase [Sulfitobacter sp. JL08]AXI53186.1 2-octaprenyl-6-methoxyphenyl hydroxylase [Sulfitobacter sp. JL08]